VESTGSSTTLTIDHTVSFGNAGKLWRLGDSHLILDTDTVSNSGGTVPGRSAPTPAIGRALELKTTTIDNGTVTNHGVLEATSGVAATIRTWRAARSINDAPSR